MATLETPKTTFSPDNVKVIFVLGGPGAGKGTQCANLVRDYSFTHLSAGDLLRAEQDRKDSEYGEMIKDYIREGKIVPMEVTIKLLENAMKEDIEDKKGNGLFLVDGFPRKMDQAVHFEQTVVPSLFTLFFDCPEEELEKRLLNRGKTSGRSDDNIESIRKRFKTFEETSMPVIEYFDKQGKVENLPAIESAEEVYQHVRERMKKRGIPPNPKG